MLAPKTIQDALIAKYRAIPALVALMKDGSSSNIAAYIDEWPKKADLLEAVRDMDPGTMLIAHQETGPANLARMEVWRHRFSVYLKPLGLMSDAWFQIVNGVSAGGDGLAMYLTEVTTGLHRMDTPSIRRQFLPVNEFTVIDYFEINISFAEKGF